MNHPAIFKKINGVYGKEISKPKGIAKVK